MAPAHFRRQSARLGHVRSTYHRQQPQKFGTENHFLCFNINLFLTVRTWSFTKIILASPHGNRSRLFPESTGYPIVYQWFRNNLTPRLLRSFSFAACSRFLFTMKLLLSSLLLYLQYMLQLKWRYQQMHIIDTGTWTGAAVLEDRARK